MELFAQIAHEAQALQLLDGLTILTLAVLEGVLSVDNALVLAILVRGLPREQQKKALTYGIVGAFAFRFLALVFATHLMELLIFKLLGGAYLVYLAMKHMFFFFQHEAHQQRLKTGGNFWKTVLVVELTDIAFSIDSITTAVAMSDKLLIVWIGGILGIIALRFAAGFFIRLLEKLPRLEDLAYQLIFFIGTKLTLEGFHVEIEHGIFWLMMAVIAILGGALVYRDWWQRRHHTRLHDQLMQRLQQGETTIEEVLNLDDLPRETVQAMVRHGWLEIRGPAGNDRAE